MPAGEFEDCGKGLYDSLLRVPWSFFGKFYAGLRVPCEGFDKRFVEVWGSGSARFELHVMHLGRISMSNPDLPHTEDLALQGLPKLVDVGDSGWVDLQWFCGQPHPIGAAQAIPPKPFVPRFAILFKVPFYFGAQVQY